ncbi:MAG: four-carbon acid sugar kinase family protein [Blautia sp.]|nr:four-carbon acid sugar kinase family protein [Blautia sp.]
MVRLVVIADDFTGALDTGIQFHAKDSEVFVCNDREKSIKEKLAGDLQVLIVDAETRHLKAEEAYRIIYRIAKLASEMGVPYLYKKTDSGLRGNIGSELTAFLDASTEEAVHFFPAFPKMGRITRNGVHFIDGVPVAESVFGKDPFEPVLRSSVKEIIEGQSRVPVSLCGTEPAEQGTEGICVYDSATDDDMFRLGCLLKEQGRLHLMAGCAGFAAVLFRLLGLAVEEETDPCFPGGLLTICGSISAVTAGQLDHASGHGMKRVVLTPEQKLSEGWIDSEEGSRSIAVWKDTLRAEQCLIIECGVHDLERTTVYIKENGLTQEEARKRISGAMGGILKRMLDAGADATLLVTGGDTLLAFMQEIGVDTLVPLCEMAPGVVLSKLSYRGRSYRLLSKSGGFGQEDILIRLADRVGQNTGIQAREA